MASPKKLEELTKKELAQFAAQEELAAYGLSVPKGATQREIIAMIRAAQKRKVKALAEQLEAAEAETAEAEEEPEEEEEAEEPEEPEEEEEAEPEEIEGLEGFSEVTVRQDQTGIRRPKGPGFSISRQTLSVNVPGYKLFGKKVTAVNVAYNPKTEQIALVPGKNVPLRIREMQRKGEDKKVVSYYLNIADLLRTKGYGDKYKLKGVVHKVANALVLDVPKP